MLRSKTGTDSVGPGAAAAGVAASGWTVGWLVAVDLSGAGVADSTRVGAGEAFLDTAGVDVTVPPQAHNPSIARLKRSYKGEPPVALASGRSMDLINDFLKR